MLLKIISSSLIVLFVNTSVFAAPTLPGLTHKSYKLKSFSKTFRGKKTESRSGRDRFCGEKISPKLRDVDGKLTFELSPSTGFEWRNIDENPTETSDGCRYPVTQTIESGRDSSALVLINAEDCGRGKSVVGSQRDTVQVNGSEIIYSSESVIKVGAGSWRVDDAKESFTCVWTAVE